MSNLTKFFLTASFLVLGGVSAANAQITNGSAVKVVVPDSFVVNNESFSAGVYTIERTPSTVDSPSLLIIRGENGEAMLFDTIISRPSKAANETELIFDNVGGTNILSEIIVEGQPTAYRITKTKAQKRMIAEGVSVSQVVTVANTGF
jgi:hypothetical protein